MSLVDLGDGKDVISLATLSQKSNDDEANNDEFFDIGNLEDQSIGIRQKQPRPSDGAVMNQFKQKKDFAERFVSMGQVDGPSQNSRSTPGQQKVLNKTILSF